MRSLRLILPGLLLALPACSQDDPVMPPGEEPQTEPRGTYDVDAATGETSARFVADDGTVTTMRSGERVPLALPQGFTLYPGAEAVNVARVEQGSRRLLTVDLRSDARPAQIVEHYLAEAEAAGYSVEASLRGDATQIIAGTGPDGEGFSLVASRNGDMTSAQITIGDPFK